MGKTKTVLTKAKKKEAVARASIKEGRGVVRINRRSLDTVEPEEIRLFISEPLIIAKEFGKNIEKIDISVNVCGGGFMAQAVAARAAIAKGLVNWYKDKKLEKEFKNYDRMLLVDDPRRAEPKKPLGRGARAKKMKSKR